MNDWIIYWYEKTQWQIVSKWWTSPERFEALEELDRILHESFG